METFSEKYNREELLTVHEAAARLKVKVSFLYELSREGNKQIPSLKIGKFRRWRWGDLIAYFEQKS